MKFDHCRKIVGMNGLHCLLETSLIVSVREQVSMIEHFDPNLAIPKNLGGTRILQNMSRREGRNDHSGLFQIVFHRLPGQFKAVLEALNGPFLFQRVQRLRAVFQRTAKQSEGTGEILESLLPSNVVAQTHEPHTSRTLPHRIAPSAPGKPWQGLRLTARSSINFPMESSPHPWRRLLWTLSAALLLLSASLLTAAPVMVETLPAAGTTVEGLTTMEVHFDTAVSGVDAEDLLINGSPATTLAGASASVYVFSFPQPPGGVVEFRWRDNSGIVDAAQPTQGFAGGSWKLTYDPALARRHVMISEFMAENDVTLYDDDCDRPDWIELFNSGTTVVNLLDWSLTDDATQLGKWKFPAYDLQPGSYLVVFASQKNKTFLPARACRTHPNSIASFHTNFRLDPGGEYLALVAPDGEVISDFGPTYPPQRRDVSYGRDSSSPGVVGYFTKPTPGAANSNTGDGFALPVRFSHPGLTFVDLFRLTLHCDHPNAVIQYTTDGSLPVPGGASVQVYTGPILLTNTTQIRARATERGLLPGAPSSETYLMLTPDLNQLATMTSSIPILVLTTLKNASIGASVNTSVHMSVFEPRDGRTSLMTRPTLATRAGIKTRGSSTGSQPQSNFAIEWWDEFNQDRDLGILGMPKDSEWVLYAPSDLDPTMLHNPFTMGLSRQMNFSAPETRFVEVYLNRGGPLKSTDWFGLYVLMQKPGLAKGRIEEPKAAPEDVALPEVSGSYLFKTDRLDPGDSGFSAGGAQNAYVEPKEREMRSPQRAPQVSYLSQFFRNLDFSLRSTNPNLRDPVLGYRAYLDLTNWIDYHILELLSGQVDAIRLSSFFYKPRNGPLKYGPRWDYDRAWESKADDRDNNPRVWDTGGGLFGAPWWNRLLADRDAWQTWIDRWTMHRRTTLSQTNMFAFIDSLTNQIRFSQPREVRKWSITAPRINYNNEIGIMKSWISNRLVWLDTQFASPPVFPVPSGTVPPGTFVNVLRPATVSSSTNVTIYYTLDGSDPRPPDGITAPTALVYTGPIPITTNTRVTARLLDKGRIQRGTLSTSPWSAPVAATYVVTPPALALTELMYHPAPPPPISTNSPGDFEFVEVKNISTAAVDLTGYRFTSGVDFNFAGTNALRNLEPGQRAVVVRNRDAFLARYPGLEALVAGEYSGQLSGAGERITLTGPAGETIFDVTYSSTWQPITDGLGFSLVPKDEATDPTVLGEPARWRRSVRPGGSPGAQDPTPGPDPAHVVVNEILSAPDTNNGDWIELYNPEDRDADVSGWYLTDTLSEPRRVPLPAGSHLPAHGYLVIPRKTFNPSPGVGFGISAGGDAVWLLSADAAGALTGWIHGTQFGASLPGVSFGRMVSADGTELWSLQSKPTPGAANAGPLAGPVILSEIAPTRSLAAGTIGLRDAFVELANVSAVVVPLFDPVATQRTWHLRGDVDFEFPADITLAPGERVLVVEFDPTLDPFELAGFRVRHRISESVRIFGPWRGGATGEGIRVRLLHPAPTASGSGSEVTVEAASFNSTGAAASGFRRGWSLTRRIPWGDAADATQWAATPSTPGEADDALDGIPDAWAQTHGLPLPVGPANTEIDTDGDGFTDRAEQRNGTDPLDPTSNASVRVFVSHRGVVTGFFDATPGRVFVVESNGGLNDPFWTADQTLTVPADGTLVVSFETRLQENRLFRLRSRD